MPTNTPKESVQEDQLAWVERQRAFYNTRPHQHLQYAPQSVYAKHLVQHVVQAAQLPQRSQVLEIGCGAGRFTVDLLQRLDGKLVALDLSENLLRGLRRQLEQLPVEGRAKWELVMGDVYHLDTVFGEARFDAVVGFFFLHHLDDLTRAIQELRKLLRPNGQMLFVEPNRRNPLFLLQVLCCPDMSWSEEKGMFTLGQARIRTGFVSAGMSTPTIQTFGWFPPQLLDRWRWTMRVEEWVEQQRLFRPILPFRIIRSQRIDRE